MHNDIRVEKNEHKSKTKSVLFNSLGILFTITGVIGIVVPVLPTTVFFIMAGALFIKTSPGMYRWLHNNRITGAYLKVYTLGEGMSKTGKMKSVSLLWLTLFVSAWFVRDMLWLLLLLSVIGISVSLHIITIKSHRISSEKLAEHERIMNSKKNGKSSYEHL